MDPAFLKPLYDSEPPIASVYLDTQRDQAFAVHHIDVRWRRLRAQLEAEGAGRSTLDAVQSAVGTDRGLPHPQGQAIFAADGQVLLAEELRQPPLQNEAFASGLPHTLPLLAQHETAPVVVLAFASRTGADFEVYTPSGDRLGDESVEIDDNPVHKMSTADRYEGRYQRWIEETWKSNAKESAKHLGDLAARCRAGLIVVSGDPHARQLLADYLDAAWSERTVLMPEGSRALGADRGPERAAALALAAQQQNGTRAAEIDRYRQGLVDGGAIDGLAETVERVGRGDVDTVLLEFGNPELDTPVYWGAEAGELAMSADGLALTGAGQARCDPAGEVLVRAMARGGGNVLLTAGGEPGPAHGVAAVLRYT
jgi:Bacterial archaeo-eukaryotic release factor family 2